MLYAVIMLVILAHFPVTSSILYFLICTPTATLFGCSVALEIPNSNTGGPSVEKLSAFVS